MHAVLWQHWRSYPKWIIFISSLCNNWFIRECMYVILWYRWKSISEMNRFYQEFIQQLVQVGVNVCNFMAPLKMISEMSRFYQESIQQFVQFGVNVRILWQHWTWYQKWIIFKRSASDDGVHFEVNACSFMAMLEMTSEMNYF
jgi:hypothetical protein